MRGARRELRDTVPHDILGMVRRTSGVDVSDVPIRRGQAVAEAARSFGARAFTRGAEVFLPAQEGPADEPVARGLLAHELTHAAQQRALGPDLPDETSPAGRALEAEAVTAERWARGLGSEPVESTAPAASSWTAPWHAASATGVQRQAEDVTTVAEPEAPAAPGAADAEPRGSAAAPVDEEMNRAREKLLDLSTRRPLDLDSPGDLEELTSRIYQGIQRRLRRDLVIDRERAGRLGETGPFGPAR